MDVKMNVSLKRLLEYKILAEDGEIGHVDDLLFDDSNWRARYLVVNTGTWLFGRRTLIAPMAVTGMTGASDALPVSMTKQQIKDSPDIGADPPLSREMETAYHDYYGWPYYWGLDPLAGSVTGFPILPPELLEEPTPVAGTEGEVKLIPPAETRDMNLRSAHKIRGCHLKRNNGEELGKVIDFIVEAGDEWTLSHAVIELKDHPDDRHVLLPTALLMDVTWPDVEAITDVAPGILRSAPAFDEDEMEDTIAFERANSYFGQRLKSA